MASIVTKDSDWIRQAFMLPVGAIDAADMQHREFTTASLKFSDTRLGGNVAINNPPQYTRYCDLKASGRLFANNNDTRHGTRGMGRYYSEQLDDNGQYVTMQFGVPQYNGMTSFFTGFYNGEAGILARTGRAPSAFYWIGRAAGFIASLYAWKIIALGYFFRFAAVFPPSKYYYLKEAMGQYWNRVNTIINTLGVYQGLIPRIYNFPDPATGQQLDPETVAGDTSVWTETDRKVFNDLAPDIFMPDGGIDIFAVANKYQRAANQHYKRTQEILSGVTSEDDLKAKMNSFRTEFIDPNAEPHRSLDTYLEQYHGSKLGSKVDGSKDYTMFEDSQYDKWVEPVDKNKQKGMWEKVGGALREYAGEYALADLREGFKWVTFRVDYTGPVGESFSNSVRESEIQSKINGISSSAKNARFSFSDGNTGIGVVDGVMGALRDVATGAADQLHIAGLISLAGAAFVDIPKHWDSSTATMPRSSYTIELRSPYGNVMSRFMNLYVPLAMLLAGALPLSTGKQSYTSPFICQLYCRGRNQIRLGLIDSLTITRGVGNLGWTADSKPLGIDVSFSVVDMSSVMHAPISPGYSLINPLDGLFDDDNAWTDYLATLSSLTVQEQVYTTRKLVLNLTRKIAYIRGQFTAANISQGVMDTMPGRMLSSFFMAAARTTAH